MSHRAECLEQLAAAITAVVRDHPTRVAIDGVDGAGKTALANELVAPILKAGRQVIRASVDGFHNPREIRYARGSESPIGYFNDSFDYATLQRELLHPLGPEGSRIYKAATFDYRVNRPVEPATELALHNAVLLFDGVFLLRNELAPMWDFRIWVEVPFEISIERAVARDVRQGCADPVAVRKKYLQRYIPGQGLYLTQCTPRDRADVVFDNTDLDHPRVENRLSRAFGSGDLDG